MSPGRETVDWGSLNTGPVRTSSGDTATTRFGLVEGPRVPSVHTLGGSRPLSLCVFLQPLQMPTVAPLLDQSIHTAQDCLTSLVGRRYVNALRGNHGHAARQPRCTMMNPLAAAVIGVQPSTSLPLQ